MILAPVFCMPVGRQYR